jgi:hypothetical protein
VGFGVRPRRVCLVVCAVALALALPAATAQAWAPRSFFGVAAWAPPSPDEFIRMGGAGIGVYRSNMQWSIVEAHRGRRDWRYYDDLVYRTARAGMRLFPTLVVSPRWAAKRETYPPRAGRPMKRWLKFVKAAVNRYGRRGRFWRQHPELPNRPVREWMVWNEPNVKPWWRNHPNARQYKRFLARSRRAIKRGDKRAKVVLAGLPETRYGVPMRRYLPAVYRAGARRLFDAVAVHGYARSGRGAAGVVKRARSIMRRYGDGRKPILVTELGWATGGPVSRRTSAYKTTPEGQAKKLSQAMNTFRKVRKRYRIGLVVWFSWRDRLPISGERDWWGLHTGLFDLAGNPKPSWQALVQATGGDPGLGSVPPAPPPPPPPGGGGGGNCPLPIVCP